MARRRVDNAAANVASNRQRRANCTNVVEGAAENSIDGSGEVLGLGLFQVLRLEAPAGPSASRCRMELQGVAQADGDAARGRAQRLGGNMDAAARAAHRRRNSNCRSGLRPVAAYAASPSAA